MFKRFLFLFSAIVVLSAVVFFSLDLRERVMTLHNAGIDYSCQIDSDCVVKNISCGQCYGVDQGCVNKDSVEGLCLRDTPEFTCTIFPERAQACECKVNLCVPARKGGASVTGPYA